MLGIYMLSAKIPPIISSRVEYFSPTILNIWKYSNYFMYIQTWNVNFRNVRWHKILLHGKKRSGSCNVDENRIEQCFVAHIVHSCQQYCCEQYCYTRFRLNNIVQYCWQVWTTWAAKHCSILLSSGLGVFLPCNWILFIVLLER